MRAFSIVIACAVLPALPATADLLSAADVLKSIEGRWAISDETDPDPELTFRCEQSAVNIWIEDAGDSFVYHSRHEDREDGDSSIVMMTPLQDGSNAPWLLLQYDGVLRLTDDGEPVRWRLLMFDENNFVWSREDWELKGSTKIRTRCLEADIVS